VVLPVSPENCVVLVFLVWFSYKPDTSCGCRVCICFWPFHKLVIFLFLNEKAELMSVALKKKRGRVVISIDSQLRDGSLFPIRLFDPVVFEPQGVCGYW
jgi:hypothetical protein